jgi:hypothetical protein
MPRAPALTVRRNIATRHKATLAMLMRNRQRMVRGEGDFERARLDPEWFLREWLGDDPYDRQVDILEAVRDHRRTTVRGCHSAGKDFLTARAVLWYLHAFSPSVVITTAPSSNQVENILWREIRHAAASARRPLYGRALFRRYEIGANHYALGFKASDAAPERFQGFHSTYLLVVVDEAAGVPDPIYDALDSLLSSEGARLLMIGNPTTTSGRFYESFHSRRDLYHTLTIPASDTPNMRAGRVVRPYLITQQWIDEAVAQHGADSPYVQSRVHAVFPDVSVDDTLMPLAMVERCSDADPLPTEERPEAGLDCARFGDDENALCVRQGPNVLREHRWSGMDTMETVGKVRSLIPDPRSVEELKVDVIGLGAGVADRLRELGYPVVDVNVGARSSDRTQFYNLRDELWWLLKERFREDLIRGPISEKAKGQLASIRYKYDSSHTKPRIESKEEARARRVGSPDAAEAIMLAFAKLRRQRRMRVLA